MFPFDVILFDVGGVLLTNGWDHRERAAVLDQFHLDHAAFEARHPQPNDAWERDAISLDEYLTATVFYEPRSFTRDEFFAAMCAQSQLLADSALPILEELAALGHCRLGALNNEARATNDYRFATYGLRRSLDFAFSSCYVGLRKPESAIYKRAIDILGCPPERILLIDDRAENTTAASKAGMRSIQFLSSASLRETLTTFSIL